MYGTLHHGRDARPPKNRQKNGSVVILGGLSLVNSLHAYTFASLKRKKLANAQGGGGYAVGCVAG